MLSGESFRRCLVDEAKAKEVDAAREAARLATANANAEAGRSSELRALLKEERAKSDGKTQTIGGLEIRVEQLESRKRFGTGLVIGGVAGAILGGVLGALLVGAL